LELQHQCDDPFSQSFVGNSRTALGMCPLHHVNVTVDSICSGSKELQYLHAESSMLPGIAALQMRREPPYLCARHAHAVEQLGTALRWSARTGLWRASIQTRFQ
jgi:hypothetical protein